MQNFSFLDLWKHKIWNSATLWVTTNNGQQAVKRQSLVCYVQGQLPFLIIIKICKSEFLKLQIISVQGKVMTSIIKCGMELNIPSQTWMVALLKFGNG